ncbi:hypothetical protein [Kitasatospora sp. NPDC056181]|uniref:hypothetical protein n=1 Tax=Kitasatospora sp. NPDC056181 TaxID=3345737 RepID=UPI0035D9BF0E
MTTPPTLQTDDAAVRIMLSTLAGHVQTMRQHGDRIEAIRREIGDHFKAACSTLYQQSIDDWHVKYGQLQTQYDHFTQNLHQGYSTINTAHEQALGVVTGGGSHSNYVLGELNR